MRPREGVEGNMKQLPVLNDMQYLNSPSEYFTVHVFSHSRNSVTMFILFWGERNM
jgi:hypothetical protein